jgi:DNA-binding MarR family transcriptional regulator
MENPAYLIGDSSRLMRRAFDAQVRALGVTGPQARLLLVLARAEGENQGFYADSLDVEPITLCRMVDRMEEAELVERRHDPTDRRAWRLHLTPRSRDMVSALRECIDKLVDEMFEGLDAAEREAFVNIVGKIRSNLAARRENRMAANG